MTEPSPPPNPDQRIPAIAPLFRLQWEPVQDAHVLLFPEGMIKLNGSSAEILTRCDGRRPVGDIIAELSRQFEADVAADVRAFLELCTSKGWVVWRDGPAP